VKGLTEITTPKQGKTTQEPKGTRRLTGGREDAQLYRGERIGTPKGKEKSLTGIEKEAAIQTKFPVRKGDAE